MDLQNGNNKETEAIYKTKIIQFLGRSVPIILQNDNGPCPLLAICNVLLLQNNLNLSLDTEEISSSRLLSLVAERFLDSNSNIGNKDDEYASNQQQNISDAITLLPNLATGLDVNVRFRNIHDFEFTPECAVFDLLDISLVHGWLCDPQDEVTSKIIGDKSYNTLAEKLVELRAAEPHLLDLASTDDVEFHATIAESLINTSPSDEVLLEMKASSELETEKIENAKQKRKGDEEEEAQLLQALNISMADKFPSEADSSSGNADSGSIIQSQEDVVPPFQDQQSVVEKGMEESNSTSCNKREPSLQISKGTDELHCGHNGGEVLIFQQNDGSHDRNASDSVAISELQSVCIDESEVLPEKRAELDVRRINLPQDSAAEPLEIKTEHDSGHAIVEQASLLEHHRDISLNSCYDGETDVGTSDIENRKPLHEGEGMLPEYPQQIGCTEEGIIIHNFLHNHASQLTIYGLFCLQEGLKERELCVFFRNNHFNTMFKYNGQLYLLVTDQGYLNQSDIVWERLDEVHGDTVLMTGAFVPFQGAEGNGLWDEQSVIAATEDFLSSQKDTSSANKRIHTNNTDLQLAMSLQHQEFEQQKQTRSTTSTSGRPQPQTSHGKPDGSKLITGPRKSSYSSKPDTKSNCVIM